MKKITYILTACMACLSACSCNGKIVLPGQLPVEAGGGFAYVGAMHEG